METMKTCSACKQVLPLEDFGRRRASKDGLSPICRECNKIKCTAYHVAHKEEAASKKKKYQEKHREKIAISRKACREANKEKIKQQRAPYLLAHKDAKAEYDRVYSAARSKEIVRRVREWRKANPSARKAQKMKRRALKLGSAVEPLPSNYEEGLYEAQHGLCYYCGGNLEETGYHRDHMTPLTREGAHSLANLCLSCPTCNLKKGTKTAEEFAIETVAL